ncbi:hypothetical protein B0H11DRAFT_1905318 [Mycena galericulata]|nr:hypothetical protein B0H11DRAFT_1905318 [Mycena galericulata]
MPFISGTPPSTAAHWCQVRHMRHTNCITGTRVPHPLLAWLIDSAYTCHWSNPGNNNGRKERMHLMHHGCWKASAKTASLSKRFPSGGGSFPGDFFGEDYTAADFDYTHPSDFSDSDSDSDDEGLDNDPSALDREAAADAEIGNGWEPLRPSQNSPMDDTEMEDAVHQSEGRIFTDDSVAGT